MIHQPKKSTGIARVVRATGHSFEGLSLALKTENAFRQEAVMAVILLPAALWLARSWVEFAWLGGALMLVLIVELLNSAVEAAIDRISLDVHPLSKRAKDMGSAAVFLSIITCSAIWIAALCSRFEVAF